MQFRRYEMSYFLSGLFRKVFSSSFSCFPWHCKIIEQQKKGCVLLPVGNFTNIELHKTASLVKKWYRALRDLQLKVQIKQVRRYGSCWNNLSWSQSLSIYMYWIPCFLAELLWKNQINQVQRAFSFSWIKWEPGADELLVSTSGFGWPLCLLLLKRWSGHPLRRVARRWIVSHVWDKNRYLPNLL